MPAVNSKRDALIAEGLSEAEADFMVSGGTKTDGLNLSGDNAAGHDAKTSASADETMERLPDASVKDGQVEEDELDPNAAVPYQKYSRDKKRFQGQIKERDDRLATTTAELAAEREKWARLDERMRVFREAAESPDPAAAQPQPRQKPDREADPFGYMAWQEEQLEGLRSELNQFT